jgi:hypothetical protein
MKNKIILFLSLFLAFQLFIPLTVQADSNSGFSSVPSYKNKELNFVMLHGAGGTACGLQNIGDTITDMIPLYVESYKKDHPTTKITFNILNRCYPANVDMETWAQNIGESINEYLPGKRNLILIGHSFGGKSALYSVAHNIEGLKDKTLLVVTINSPIKPLNCYPVSGAPNAIDLCKARFINSDKGVCSSLANYDSTEDGRIVSEEKHWLALVSGENTPGSDSFNYGGIDPYTWHCDDGVIPISGQYTEDADTVYYGEYYHSDFHEFEELYITVSETILNYIFGTAENGYSVLSREDSFTHKSDWWLGKDTWSDILGDTLAKEGATWHFNDSYMQWREWEDVAGGWPFVGDAKSRYYTTLSSSSGPFTNIEETRWFDPANIEDCQIYIKTKAGPRQYVQVDWKIYQQSLSQDYARDHYEIEIEEGTALTAITRATWLTDNERDLRVSVQSQAESPFKWFKAICKIFVKEPRYRNLIDDI